MSSPCSIKSNTIILRFDVVTMFTQPTYDLFVNLAKWEADSGNDIL